MTFFPCSAVIRSVLGVFLAAAPLAAQTMPPVRVLGPAQAASAPIFKNASGVRQLSDGRLLVNDPTGHQIVALDGTLANPVVLIDSAAGRDNSYGLSSGGLIPYLADSTIFVDRTTQALVVIGPSGQVARVAALPARGTINYLLSTAAQYGFPTATTSLGLVYETPQASGPPPQLPEPGMPDVVILQEDTSYIVAYNLTRASRDTVGRIATGHGIPMRFTSTGPKMELPNRGALLLRAADAWAVTTDGSVALVRGRDYHIDWVGADGSRTSSPRIAHDWQHYTDDDKAHYADSVNRTIAVSDSAALAGFLRDSIMLAGPKGDSIRRARGQALVNSFAASGAPAEMLAGLAKSGGMASTRPEPGIRMQMTDVPEYRPVIGPSSGNVRSDGDNNVWIRTSAGPLNSLSPVWDVVNRQGVLIDRIRIPDNRSIVGFGPGGIVYLLARDAGKAIVERVRWK